MTTPILANPLHIITTAQSSGSPGIQDKKIPATLRGGDQNNSK